MKTRLRSTNRRTSERRILRAFRAAMGLRGCRPDIRAVFEETYTGIPQEEGYWYVQWEDPNEDRTRTFAVADGEGPESRGYFDGFVFDEM